VGLSQGDKELMIRGIKLIAINTTERLIKIAIQTTTIISRRHTFRCYRSYNN
jgi:hypothetical protein